MKNHADSQTRDITNQEPLEFPLLYLYFRGNSTFQNYKSSPIKIGKSGQIFAQYKIFTGWPEGTRQYAIH